jgi:hypothetical protein
LDTLSLHDALPIWVLQTLALPLGHGASVRKYT